jgi:hypothetical protein
MRLISAPERNWPFFVKPWVFLAGGITNCPDWQQRVIKELKACDGGVLFNPRREDFNIHDPNAAGEQIKWEYDALMMCDIFTMWFCNAPSDQPICMYELGRYFCRYQLGRIKKVVIGVEPGYKRAMDVLMQLRLADPSVHVFQDFEAYISMVKETIGSCQSVEELK